MEEQFTHLKDNQRYLTYISGGLDSALVAYLAMLHFPNSKFLMVTGCHTHMDNYNETYAKAIVAYLKERFPEQIITHLIDYYDDREHARSERTKRSDHKKSSYNIDGLLSGLTMNPINVPELMDAARDRRRDQVHKMFNVTFNSVGKKITSHIPFINDDKKVIAALYEKYDIMDLAALTISCESLVPPRPCETCWWCREKNWAFNFF